MRTKISRAAGGLPAGVLLALAVSSGCGPGERQPADPDAARAALRSALDAWKRGDLPESLGKTEPPVHVSDWRWRSGAKLVRYEIAERGRPIGADLRCPVQLWIDNGRGKATRELAEYNVSTHPALAVARSGDR
jgi:hypothetical protein